MAVIKALKDFLAIILYFPLWWYGRGLKKSFIFSWQKIKKGWQGLALSILILNFFKPMYGQRGFAAYVLSLGVRFWQLLWRLLLMFVWAALWLAVFLLWIILPVFSIWQLFLLIIV